MLRYLGYKIQNRKEDKPVKARQTVKIVVRKEHENVSERDRKEKLGRTGQLSQ